MEPVEVEAGGNAGSAAAPEPLAKRPRSDDGSSSPSLSLSELDLSSSDGPATPAGVACAVCGLDLGALDEPARHAHVNHCLEVGVLQCEVCGKPLADLTLLGRAAHVNRCVDRVASRDEVVMPSLASSSDVRGGAYRCVVCGKDLAQASEAARLQHVKNCAKRRGVGPGQVPPRPPANRVEVFRDPVSGFTRHLGPQPRAGSGQKRPKPRADDDLQLGLVLSVSLVQPHNDSDGDVADAEVPDEPRDAAGFPASPTVSQVARRLMPSPVARTPAVSAAPVPELPPSRLAAAAPPPKRSLWGKAAERPNVEAGRYEASARVPPAGAVDVDAATTDASRAALPVLRVAAPREVEARAELVRISDAYERECRDALQVAESAMRAAASAYYHSVGRAAVERDAALEALVAHYGSMEVSLLQLPRARPPPAPTVLQQPSFGGDLADVEVFGDLDDPEAEQQDDFLARMSPILLPHQQAKPAAPEEHALEPVVVSGPPSPLHLTAGSFLRPAVPAQLSTTVERIASPATPARAPSPCPDFDHMPVEELRRRYDGYGLQHARENVMRQKLRELWLVCHEGLLTETQRIAAAIQAEGVPLDDSLTPYRPPKVRIGVASAAGGGGAAGAAGAGAAGAAGGGAPTVAKRSALGMEAAAQPLQRDEDEDDVERPDAAGEHVEMAPVEEESFVDASVDASIIRFVKSSPYFERMLLFEPIPVLQLKEDLLAKGVRISKPDLCNFLDRKSIVFQDPQSKWK